MNQIYCIGWNHQNSPVVFREKLALSSNEIVKIIRLAIAKPYIIEFASLVTCNRVEFYFITNKKNKTLQTIQEVYKHILERNISWNKYFPQHYIGIEVIKHLSRVATGMESMIIGEKQIYSQVMKAKDIILRSNSKSTILDQLFVKSMESTNLIRENTNFYSNTQSISDLVILAIKKIFKYINSTTMMVIGAGEIAKLTSKLFLKKGGKKLFLVSRNDKIGQTLAESIYADYININNIDKKLLESDIILTATHSKEYLIKRISLLNKIKNRRKPLLLLDISIPRNIDPDLGKIQNVYLYDLDSLKNISADKKNISKKELEDLEKIIKNQSIQFIKWFQSYYKQNISSKLSKVLD